MGTGADFLTTLLPAGGKAKGIHQMMGAGFRVPATVFFASENLGTWIRGLPGHTQAIADWARWPGDATSSPESLEKFCATLKSAGVPVEWPACFSHARAALGTGTWIVRSSMSVEDAATTSFAGAYRSVHVPNPTVESLWKAVTTVLASAFETVGAVQLLTAGHDPRDLLPGFFIQKYIPAKFAGVCFTRKPDQVWVAENGVVEWARGPGEGVVQGSVATRIDSQSEGADPISPLAPLWTELWATAVRAEALVGGPADVEWVWDGKALWFVQARPIASEEARLFAASAGSRWTRALSLERFPEPVTPIGWTAIEDSMQSNLENLRAEFGIEVNGSRKMAVRLRSRVYSDPDFFKFPSRVKVRWHRYLTRVPRLLFALLRHCKTTLLARSREAAKAVLKLELLQILIGPQSQVWQNKWQDHVSRGRDELEAFKVKWMRLGSERPSAAVLLERMEELRAISLRFLEPDFTVFIVKDALHRALEGVWLRLGRPALGFVDLLSCFNENRTLGMSREWVELTRLLARDQGSSEFIKGLTVGMLDAHACLAPETREKWKIFLERNGHNRTSWDIAVPCWNDSPAALAPLLASSLQGVRNAKGVVELQKSSTAELFATLRAAGLMASCSRVADALERLRDFMRMDEELHFLTGLLLEPSRRLVLAAGSELVGLRLLEKPEDAFFLELAELKAALRAPKASLKFLAQRRRAEFERAWKNQAPLEFPPEKTPLVPTQPQGNFQHLGVAVSSGVVEGVVVIAEHLEAVGQLQPGSVLVTTAPNPAFVPLYPLLGAIVSVTGGILSHGFVAAREFGLPAVSGIADATTTFRNGMRVRVDGGRGVVEVL
ncbi:MAG: hypothetical protein HY074_13015 [Deltaproteobacteria bacterium]|nr:hypothetical protein [Deltaproteobacteria bacterium]